MALRSPDAYRQSLKDGRRVIRHGLEVPDVTQDPLLRHAVDNTAVDFWMAEAPEYRDLAVVEDETAGPVSRYLVPPRTAEDLARRRELIEVGSRLCRGFPPFAKEIGTDALFALMTIAPRVDEACGTDYTRRVEEFRQYLMATDPAMATAMTDVKGDRSLRPHQQADPDLYARVVDRRADGIVIRGAKIHITNAPVANELMVLPTRAMTEADAAYAVACAVPANAPGVTMVVRSTVTVPPNPFDYPLRARHDFAEALILFDDVFVPHERVFLNGEWPFAGPLANTFAVWHRMTAAAYKIASAELLAGSAQLVAEYNGLERSPIVRDKVTSVVIYCETLKALNRMTAEHPHLDPVSGIATPNPLYSNLTKYYFAEGYHNAVRQVQDVAGGLLVTGPSEADLNHPEVGEAVARALQGKAGVSGPERLRLMNFIRDLAASELGGGWEVVSIHAEGTLAVLRLTLHAQAELDTYKQLVREAAGLVPASSPAGAAHRGAGGAG